MGNINLLNFLQIKLASVLFLPGQENKTNKGRKIREKPKTHYTDRWEDRHGLTPQACGKVAFTG